MSEWWTYGLSDFLMFSPRVYHRLIAATNAALWPAQIGTTLLGLVAAALIVAPRRGATRVVLPVLGGLWIVVAWAFLWERYATINWGILYAAPAFALQGLLLIVAGLARMVELREPRDAASVAAAALLVAIVLGWPLLAPFDGGALDTAESFGLLPDPTALGTLAILAALRGGLRFVLAIVPVAWALVAAATLYTLGAWTWVLVPAATTLAVALALIRPRPPSPRRW
ncbi:DUF6064 family protein [Rhodoplanes sp. TEM]|uniref:DUF6064 family protein n=1 Tax=Rhodoplanes tepidamans TaxID=200616 RepID=A0ABT5JFK4_RHOTP|nr:MULTISPECIES: DUF6064 family protein [Rhodoplanes]MDC7788354.1 DUF6064 family protein [Rhodoplanes tepidamans]MDC7986096.1 DUF6064 family protein [Rhodoplanes sp. TEM]MDQ0358835.1 hypothetical protein [Rhodoplanes tepidamans]